MSKVQTSIRSLLLTASVATATFAAPAQIFAGDDAIARPETLVVAGDLSATQREVMLASARKFYQFWGTGDESLLRAVISERFVDHTLPPGRPQGPTGPAIASKTFRLAVPDLKIAVRQQILAGDRVVSHLAFSGHFTGNFQGVQGHGQIVDFIATDILRLENGKITDNWHLEDNLTFLQQIGAKTPVQVGLPRTSASDASGPAASGACLVRTLVDEASGDRFSPGKSGVCRCRFTQPLNAAAKTELNSS